MDWPQKCLSRDDKLSTRWAWSRSRDVLGRRSHRSWGHDLPLLEARGQFGDNSYLTYCSYHAFTLMSTPQTYELGWLSYLSNILAETGRKRKLFLRSVDVETIAEIRYEHRPIESGWAGLVGCRTTPLSLIYAGVNLLVIKWWRTDDDCDNNTCNFSTTFSDSLFLPGPAWSIGDNGQHFS